MTRTQIDDRLEANRKEIRETQQESNKQADDAVYAEALFKKKKLQNFLSPEVTKLKAADERKLMAEELAGKEWLDWKIAENHAKAFREKMENLRSEQSSIQTQARLLMSEMEFERMNSKWEP